MKLWTYNELETRVRSDLDLLDTDNFVSQDEMAGYANEAIADAEGKILKISGEDYFMTNATLSLVQGVADIALPSTIYGQKIRGLIYQNGPIIYPVRRIRDIRKFYTKAEIDYFATNQTEYTWILKSGAAGTQDVIELSPAAKESGALLTCWFIRTANRVPTQVGDSASRATQLATVLDIPEWVDYLAQFMKVRCYEKEMDPRLPGAMQALTDRGKMMEETLTERVPDDENTVPPDMDFYWDHL